MPGALGQVIDARLAAKIIDEGWGKTHDWLSETVLQEFFPEDAWHIDLLLRLMLVFTQT